MPETPTGPEQPRQQPIPAGEALDRPGYPPPGYEESMAALAAAEAAAHSGDADAALAGELAALDGDIESSEAREARLGTFVADHFSDACPELYRSQAVAACCNYEDQCRELFGEPDLLLGEEDAADPLLREMVENAVLAAENDDTIVALTDDELTETALLERQEADLVPVSQAERASVEAAHPEVTVPDTETGRAAALAEAEAQTQGLETRRADRREVRTEVAEDLNTIEGLQARFNELKAQHGTVGALELLLEGETALQNEEMRAIVQRTIGTARSLVTALPGREDVVTRLLDGANLNLGAATNAGAFADFLTAVNASEDLSEAEKQTLREVVGVTLNDHHPTNATELQSALREGRGTERVQVGTETVEEPPGSGNWVERPVYEERVLPYNEADRLVLSQSPLVTMFPDPPGSDTYRVEGQIADAAPIGFEIQVPAEGALPEAEIHQRMNQHLLDSVFSNAGLNGAMEYLSLRQDATLGGSADTNGRSIGQGDVLQNILQAFSGYSIDVNSRFMTETDLANITPDLRWLTINGDFGHANQNDPALTVGLMSAVFGDTATDINTNLRRANQFINAGGAEAPSYQALYAGMYPADAANGFPRLRGIIGDDAFAQLGLDARTDRAA